MLDAPTSLTYNGIRRSSPFRPGPVKGRGRSIQNILKRFFDDIRGSIKRLGRDVVIVVERVLIEPLTPPVYETVELPSPNPQATAIVVLVVILLVGGFIVTAFIKGIKYAEFCTQNVFVFNANTKSAIAVSFE